MPFAGRSTSGTQPTECILRSRYQVPQIDVIDVESRHAKRNPSSEVRTPSTVAFGERVEDIHDGFQ